MRKESSEAGVGIRVGQILLPLEWGGSNDTASTAEEDRGSPSSAATPTGERKPKKRKWHSLNDEVYAQENLRPGWEQVRSNQGAAGCDGQTLD